MKKLFVISFVLGGVIFLTGCSQKSAMENRSQLPDNLPSNQQTTESLSKNNSKMGDFKKENEENFETHRNNQYGFEFKYPRGWVIDSERSGTDAVVFRSANDQSGEGREAINFQSNNKNLSVDQAVNNLIQERGYAENQVTWNYPLKIGGERTVKVETNEFGLVIFIFAHGKMIYIVETQGFFSDQVLETLSFTQSTTETLNYCGKSFIAEKIELNGVDIVSRIMELYMAKDKDNCNNLEQIKSIAVLKVPEGPGVRIIFYEKEALAEKDKNLSIDKQLKAVFSNVNYPTVIEFRIEGESIFVVSKMDGSSVPLGKIR